MECVFAHQHLPLPTRARRVRVRGGASKQPVQRPGGFFCHDGDSGRHSATAAKLRHGATPISHPLSLSPSLPLSALSLLEGRRKGGRGEGRCVRWAGWEGSEGGGGWRLGAVEGGAAAPVPGTHAARRVGGVMNTLRK